MAMTKKKQRMSRYFEQSAEGGASGMATPTEVQTFTPDLDAFSKNQRPSPAVNSCSHREAGDDNDDFHTESDKPDFSKQAKHGGQRKWGKKAPKEHDGLGSDGEGLEVITHDLSGVKANWYKDSSTNVKKRLKVLNDDEEDGWKSKKFSKKELSLRDQDPFPGDAPVSREKVRKYKRGSKIDLEGVKTTYHKDKLAARDKKYSQANRIAARAELLLTEQPGYIEADEGEQTSDYTQHDIAGAVDISSAQKYFELKLDKFGPYRMNYTRNGRFLLIGGGKGHVAAMDWQTKKLMCEMNVMETCQDVKWLHIETMFAVAQKDWTYIYDNQGIELHCLKVLDRTLRMEFLPYHFLLVAGNARGYLTYLDVSIGKKVVAFPTHLGRLDVMCQNPSNAIIHLGHSGGTVSMWSPNMREPLVKMLCHGGGTRSVAVTHNGKYMATSGIDRTLKIWDLRTYKLLHAYKIGAGAGHMAFSQKGLLAAGLGNVVEVYQDCLTQKISSPYLRHQLSSSVKGLQFCPYEDVLGVGHGEGFSSLLIPGSGEPNFDAMEANPYQTKKQRRQAEVKMLLEKIQPDMIHLDTSILGKIDTKTLHQKLKEKEKLLYVRPQKVDFEPRHRKKGASKAGKFEQRKKGVQEEHKREQVRKIMHAKEKEEQEKEKSKEPSLPKQYNVLDRFQKKS